MKLDEYQRTLVRLSFAGEVSEADFEGFGDRARFVMYRQMIRSRLLGMAKQAFRTTRELTSPAAFDESFERYLAARPPQSPLIRDVIAEFGPFAREDAALLESAPAFTRDLLLFEESKWRVAYRALPQRIFARAPEGALRPAAEGALVAFDFAAVPVFNPALEQLALSHAVHQLEAGTCRPGKLSLLVYRPPQNDEIRWYAADPLFAEIVARGHREAPCTFADLVRSAADSLGKVLDEATLEELATGVTLALERGVLLGSLQSP